jgi:hypothetical protein
VVELLKVAFGCAAEQLIEDWYSVVGLGEVHQRGTMIVIVLEGSFPVGYFPVNVFSSPVAEQAEQVCA